MKGAGTRLSDGYYMQLMHWASTGSFAAARR